MKRSLLSILAVLFAFGGPALAAPKPTVAVLGLEVVDTSGSIDQASTAVARDLTDGLRARAKVGAGPYVLAGNSDKELIDEKLIKNCDNEAIPCMTQIGKDLGADFLIYGRLEKKADGYVVTINLLDIGKKRFVKAKTPLVIPFNQKDSASLASSAKKAYNDLAGVADNGTLTIQTNGSTGKVMIDDVQKGTLSGGTATIANLPEGRYRLAVEADGFQRSQEVIVSIRSGETTPQELVLVAGTGGTGTDPSRTITGTTSTSTSNIWKPIFAGTLVVGLGLTGYSFYAFAKWKGEVDNIAVPAAGEMALGPDNCGDAALRGSDPALESVCTNRDRNIKTGIAAGVVGLLVVGTGYMAFFRSSTEKAPAPTSTTARRTKKREFSVTPIISPTGGGATFQLDW